MFLRVKKMNHKLNKDELLSTSAKQYIVGIGASAGGLEAIESFVKRIPENSDLAFVIVQHLSPDYKSLMAELLSKHTQMPVRRIEDGMLVEKNNIYLIPPRKNLTIFHNRLLLQEQTHREGLNLNLPIDVFFKSLAEDCAEYAVAIVLSGTGSDGSRGIRSIKEHGGMVMVQDESSAKFNGMPNSAISTGLADFILPPEAMPAQLLAFAKHPNSAIQESITKTTGDAGLTRIFSLLREKSKVDFTFYKPSTVLRRIERRLTINQLLDLGEYVHFMENNPSEISTLYQELLIGVTSFFRDDFVFDEFKNTFLPQIIDNYQQEEVRLWVAACSTGEEAYTLAMLLAEYREKSNNFFKIKIFATDIDQRAIEKASLGLYPESIVADVPPELLNKYFIRREDNFQIVQKIREMVVFAQHNLLKDPPFTNISILSCRNMLIYLQPVLQVKILELFNFSLTENGILILGTSETIGEMVDYFEPVANREKIYRSRGKHKPIGIEKTIPLSSPYFRPSFTSNTHYPRNQFLEDKTLERFINGVVDDILPFTIIVDEEMQVSHIFGNAQDYLSYPSGKIVTDINKIILKELSIPVSTGIQKALKSNEDVVLSNIRLRELETLRTLKLRIKKLPNKKGQPTLIAIMISENCKEGQFDTVTALDNSYDITKEASQRILDLEQELQFTRENLQATVEELETSNEELQATNEELLASNEELQSTNEELQSVNEELYTVNAEYQGKITELTLLNNDLDNLFNSTNIATLFLDENFDVRRFTPKLEGIFHVLSSDIGRPFYHLSHSVINVDLNALVREVGYTQKVIEKELQTENGNWYLLRIMPYAVSDTVYAGVILTFVDIDQLKRTRSALVLQEQEEMQRLATFVHYSNDAITLQDLDGNIVTWNRGAEQIYGWTEEEALQMKFNQVVPANGQNVVTKVLKKIKTGEQVPEYETKRITKTGETIDVLVTASILYSKGEGHELIALTERNMSKHRYNARSECVNCMQNLASLVLDSSEAILLLDFKGNILGWNKAAYELYGWDNQQATKMNIKQLLSNDSQSDVRQLIEQLIDSDKKHHTLTCKRVTKTKEEIDVTLNASVLENYAGDVLLIVSREHLAH